VVQRGLSPSSPIMVCIANQSVRLSKGRQATDPTGSCDSGGMCPQTSDRKTILMAHDERGHSSRGVGASALAGLCRLGRSGPAAWLFTGVGGLVQSSLVVGERVGAVVAVAHPVWPDAYVHDVGILRAPPSVGVLIEVGP